MPSETPAHAPDEVTWDAGASEPCDLVVLVPGDTAPEPAATRARLAGDRPLERLPAPDTPPGLAWCEAIRLADLPAPIVMWAEPARPLDPASSAVPASDGRAMAECRWAIGLETMLDPDDPLAAYWTLVRAAAALDVVAMLDVNTTRWYPAETVATLFGRAGIEPPAEVLWTTRLVGGETAPSWWLRTQGLRRCGRPELELLEVPRALVEPAARLLAVVAERLVEEPAPPPHEPFVIGDGLALALVPWTEVARYVDPGAPGGPDSAGEGAVPAAMRAVLCGPRPEGSYRPVWRYPQDVLERLGAGDAAVYRSVRATRRRAQSARDGWETFLLARAVAPADGRLEVQLRLGADAEGGEHAWIALEPGGAGAAETAALRGRLLHDTRTAGTCDDPVAIDPERVTDWLVATAGASFGPDDLAALRHTLAGRDPS